ncbi:hypothetical protein GCM10010286_46410 [Streptomyces toxytricini]|nr:hypothetical protein GCM10010286_46410 [Streptomyces toxytricini]
MRVPRRATLLPGGATLAGRGLSDPVVRPPGRYLYGVDEAVVRAGLVAEVAEDVAEDVGGGLPDASVPAWVTSDEAGATPFATAYEIIEVLPHDAPRPGPQPRGGGPDEPTERRHRRSAGAAEPGPAPAAGGTGAATPFPTRVAGAPALLLVRPAGGPRDAS